MKNRYIIENILGKSQFSFLLKFFNAENIWIDLKFPRYMRALDNLLLGDGSMEILKDNGRIASIFNIDEYEEIDFRDFLKLKSITTIEYLKKYNGKI